MLSEFLLEKLPLKVNESYENTWILQLENQMSFKCPSIEAWCRRTQKSPTLCLCAMDTHAIPVSWFSFWECAKQNYVTIVFNFRRNWNSVCKTKSAQTVLFNWMRRWVFLVCTSERLAPSLHGLNYWPRDWVMIRGLGSRGLLGSRVQTADI